MWTEMPSISQEAKALEMALSLRESKAQEGGGGDKQYKSTGNSEGRKLAVTYWTNKLVCRQNGLRGCAGQKNKSD